MKNLVRIIPVIAVAVFLIAAGFGDTGGFTGNTTGANGAAGAQGATGATGSAGGAGAAGATGATGASGTNFAAPLVGMSQSTPTSTGTTSITITSPIGLTNGDFLAACIICDTTPTGMPSSTGWTMQGSATPSNNGFSALFTKTAASEGASWSWTWTGNCATRGAVLDFRNLTNAVDTAVTKYAYPNSVNQYFIPAAAPSQGHYFMSCAGQNTGGSLVSNMSGVIPVLHLNLGYVAGGGNTTNFVNNAIDVGYLQMTPTHPSEVGTNYVSSAGSSVYVGEMSFY